MKKNIIALIVLYNIKIHHWLKCSNKTLLNRSAVLSNFANKKWKTRYPCPHLSTILDKIKWNRKPPSPPNQGWSCAKGKKPRHFPILDLGGRGGLGFPFILSKIVAEVPTPDGFFALWTSKWPPSERDLWILQFLVLSSLVWFDQSDKVLLLKVRKFSKHYGYILLWKSNDSG